MSAQGKMIKDLIKVKKESMMGKLANEFDPMEPWSAKSDAPIKNSKGLSEEESLDESNNKILFNYIKSLGYDPKFMPFAKLSTYSRSDAFKRFKQSHVYDKNKQDIKSEEVEAIEELNKDTLHSYANKAEKDQDKQFTTIGKGIRDKDPKSANKAGHKFSMRSIGLNRAEKRLNNESLICPDCQVDPCICDDSHGFVNEAGTGHLMSFIKAKGLDPFTMDGNQKRAYSRSSEYRMFKTKHHAEAIKETSGMGERADDWNEQEDKGIRQWDKPNFALSIKARQAKADKAKELQAKADNMQKKGIKPKNMKEDKDSGEYDYEGAMAKTLLQTICRNAEALKDMLEDDENLPEWVQSKITKAEDYITTSLDYMKSTEELDEEVEQIEELSKSTLKSYVNKVVTTPGRGMTQKGTLKSIKAVGGVTKAIRKQYEKPLSELKKTPDNMDSDSIGVAREESDPCWKGYQMVGMKKKGGRSVPNCVPESVGEETAPIEVKQIRSTTTDSPTHKRMHQLNKATDSPTHKRMHQLNKAAGLGVIKTPNSPRTGVSEGIYGIEDSPTAATHSVKAMESKKMSNAAKMVKAIYKKRVNETTYDWEKSEKGGDTDPEIKTTAKITLKGGKTMTGKPRDTVEIEPVLRTKINSPNGMKPNV